MQRGTNARGRKCAVKNMIRAPSKWIFSVKKESVLTNNKSLEKFFPLARKKTSLTNTLYQRITVWHPLADLFRYFLEIASAINRSSFVFLLHVQIFPWNQLYSITSFLSWFDSDQQCALREYARVIFIMLSIVELHIFWGVLINKEESNH